MKTIAFFIPIVLAAIAVALVAQQPAGNPAPAQPEKSRARIAAEKARADLALGEQIAEQATRAGERVEQRLTREEIREQVRAHFKGATSEAAFLAAAATFREKGLVALDEPPANIKAQIQWEAENRSADKEQERDSRRNALK